MPGVPSRGVMQWRPFEPAAGLSSSCNLGPTGIEADYAGDDTNNSSRNSPLVRRAQESRNHTGLPIRHVPERGFSYNAAGRRNRSMFRSSA
jgi:hypothetical protein